MVVFSYTLEIFEVPNKYILLIQMVYAITFANEANIHTCMHTSVYK